MFQAGYRVYLYLKRVSRSRNITISTQDAIGSISNLWKASPLEAKAFSGMVHLPHLARRQIMWFGPQTGLEYRASLEAISAGCRQVIERPRHIGSFDEHQLPRLSISQGIIFPDEDVIAYTLADFFGQPAKSSLKTLAKNTLVEDIPLVDAVKVMLAKFCMCANYLNTIKQPKVIYKFERYLRNISKCIATILLASLLISNALEGVFVYLPVGKPNLYDKFPTTIYNCLRNSGDQSCSNETIIGEILNLIGHTNHLNDPDSWIMSVNHGQTVYPQILSSLSLYKTGLLSLICVPGLIIHNWEKYSIVETVERIYKPRFKQIRDHDEDFIEENSGDEIDDTSILIKDGTTMESKLFLSIKFPDLGFMGLERNPILSIWAASESFFVTCPHDRKTPLHVTKPYIITKDIGPTIRRSPKRITCSLILSDQNEPIRFFSLYTGKAYVLRSDAYLACCVRVCQVLQLGTVVC